MTVSPALTSPERTALAGITTVARYLSPVPDNVVATALVNQVSFVYPLTSLTVDTTSGGWANIREGMTLYVGSTPGGRDRGTYRVRKAGNSTTIFIAEMGSQDPGQLPMSIRSASTANNDYVTVVERYDVWSVLPRIVFTSPSVYAIYEDFDKTVGTLNTTPPPIVNVTLNGRRNHLFDLIQSGSLALTAVASVTKWPTSGASSLTYAWTVPAGWTGVSGTSTATLTASVPPGNYVLRLIVTDSVGGATERVMYVQVHSPSVNPPLVISEMPKSDVRDRSGRRMSWGLYDSHLSSMVDGAAAGYFEVCTWNGSDVPTATRQFIGWVQRQQWDGENGLRQATIDVVGPAALMERLNSTSQIIKAVASPANWQECVASLASASFMVWFMLKYRAANLLRLFDFTPFDVNAPGQRKPEWIIDKGSLLQQMQSLATERGNFGCNSEGAMFFLRHPSMIAYGSRSGVVTRDTLDASLYSSFNLTVEQRMATQQVRGEAFSWDGSAVLPTPYYSDAPKSVGQGSSQAKLGSQVVTDQAELNQLTGDHYARLNNPYTGFSLSILKNRDVIEPAEMPFVSVTIPANLSPKNVALTLNAVPINVSKRHNSDGTSDIELALEAETHGIAGDFVPVPVGNDTVYTPPNVPPPDDPLPDLSLPTIPVPASVPPTGPLSTAPDAVPGRACIRNTPTVGYRTYDIRPSAPVWDDVVVPAWYTNVSMMVMDEGKAFSRGAYIIGDNGTDSRVAYTDDVFETTPVWTLGATVTGIFTQIKSVRWIPGAVYIYGSGGSATTTYDFTISDHGFTVAAYAATYTPGVGWASGTGAGGQVVYLNKTIAATVVSSATMEWYWNGGPSSNNGFIRYAAVDDTFVGGSPHTTIQTDTTTSFDIAVGNGGGATPDGVLTSFSFTSPTSGGAQSCYSTDYGATFASPEVVDTVVGDTGFDAGPRGITALAGGDQRVRTALAGGTYANTVNGGASGSYPVSINIPDCKIGSVSLSNNPADPNFFFAAPALIASHALWKVTLAGKVGITPSVSGNKALGAEPLGLDSWRGKRVMYIGDAGGTRYVFVTKDAFATQSHTAIALARSVRIRRWSPSGYEAIVAAGTNDLEYTSNGGITWFTKTASGNNIFSQLFG